jgi:hypothetical protein
MLTLALIVIIATPPTPAPDPYAGWQVQHLQDPGKRTYQICIPKGFLLTSKPVDGVFEFFNPKREQITIELIQGHDSTPAEIAKLPRPPKSEQQKYKFSKSRDLSVGPYMLIEAPFDPLNSDLYTLVSFEDRDRDAVLVTFSGRHSFKRTRWIAELLARWIAAHNPIPDSEKQPLFRTKNASK